MDKFNTIDIELMERVHDIISGTFLEPLNSSFISLDDIGDGNMNYVFRLKYKTKDNNIESVIVKVALENTRLQGGRDINVSRLIKEVSALEMFNSISNDSVPRPLKKYIDDKMAILFIEDLCQINSNYRFVVFREYLSACNENMEKPIKSIVEALAKLYYNTSVYSWEYDTISHRKMEADMSNPELCEISERLVFNNLIKALSEDGELSSIISERLDIIDVIKKLKYLYATARDSLIHGDLHTGSIFYNPKNQNIRIFDAEFACIGLPCYDLGNLYAHLYISYANALIDNRNILAQSLENLEDKIIYYFEKTLISSNKLDNFNQSYNFYTMGYAGIELLRRLLGATPKDLSRKEVKKLVINKGIDLIKKSASAL